MVMRYQPQGLLRIDQGHPLAAGLRMAILPGVNRGFDVGGIRPAAPTGTKQSNMSSGMAVALGPTLGGGSSDKIITGLTGAFPANGRSYYFRARRNGSGGGNLGRLFDKTNGSTGQMIYWSNGSNGLVHSFYSGGSEQIHVISGTSASAAVGVDFELLITHSQVGSATAINAYVNGVLVSGNTYTGTFNDAAATALTLGNRASDNARGWDGLIECAYVWDRILTADDAAALRANRYQLFAAPYEDDEVIVAAAQPTGYTLTASPGVFAIGAPSLALRASRVMSAAAGGFTLAGEAVRLQVARRLAAAAGALSLWGAPLGLTAARRLPAGAGNFTATGGGAVFVASRRLSAAQGSLSLSAAVARIVASRRVSASAGVFALDGTSTGLAASRKLSASLGVFTLTGGSVPLTYQQVQAPGGAVNYTLTAITGSFGLSGAGVALRAQRQLAMVQGTFSLNVLPASLVYGRRLSVLSGTFALLGLDVPLRTARRIPAQAGMFDLAGMAVQLRYSAQIDYARAPAGAGYTPQRHEYQSRPAATSSPRPVATQRNLR